MVVQKWSTKKKTIVLGAVAAVACMAIVLVVLLLNGNISLFIDPQEITLEVGQTHRLSIFSADGEKQNLSAKWSSDTVAVASVDKNGVVTAKGPGRAMISAVVKKGGKEHVATTQVTVWEEGGTQIAVSGDKTQGPPDFRGEKFTVLSATDQVTYDMTAGTIQIPKSLKRSEIIFSNSRNFPCVETWDLQGTLTRSDLKDTCFLSVGVIDETGKEQWFCLYGTGLSRQRYWNWKETEYQVDNVYVGFNKAAESFYKRETVDGNRLDFRVVLIGDTLKVYFGNAKESMSLAWSLPLTQSTWGGFEKGSKYQLAINTVDPCDLSLTDVTCVNGEDVKDPGGVVGGKYADVKIKGNKFNVADSSVGVSYNGKEGTARIQATVKDTEMFFAGMNKAYEDRWEFSGTMEKEKLGDSLFLSFAVRDASGKTQWFCIYQNTLSLQKEWNWADTKQKVDGTYVKFNQAACSFFWKEKDQGAEKLHYKLILHHDVLTVYFGNDKYPMAQAWYLPLTMQTYGGFAAGSGYQIGIGTVDPLNLNIKNIVVHTGDQAAQVPSYVDGGAFVIAGSTVNVTNDPLAGAISVSDSADNSQVIFAADSHDVDNAAWQLTGTVTKPDPTKNLFLSFGVKDISGKEQWFCIYKKGLARQRNYNWADTEEPVDNVHVFANPATEHFFYKTPSLGGDKLHYAIVLENDLLKAYFGNDKYDMTLAWMLPLTEAKWGGFAPGTQYQLAINSVDPCVQNHTNVRVVTGDEVNDIWAQADLYNVNSLSGQITNVQNKLQQGVTDGVTTVFIGDSFFHQEAYFKNFASLMRNKEAVCAGISTSTTYQWETILEQWLKDYAPKNLVVNLGTNNLTVVPPYNANDQVIAALQTLLTKLQAQFPNTNIYWFSISSRNDLNRDMDKAVINAAMKQWCGDSGVIYVESPITDPAQDCVDGLHPTAETYEKYIQTLTESGCEILSKDTSGYQFFVESATTGVEAKPVDGTITISNSVSKSETMFAANADEVFSDTWQITGTVTKEEMNNLFLSFGLVDESGEEQWFCIYGKGLSRQRYWDWSKTKYDVDNKYVFANPATEHFYYKTPSLGGDKLKFAIVVQDDVLRAYFGNDQYDMTLAWELPLTEELWGSFAAGSKYQMGINTVDPCAHNYSNVKVVTGSDVNDTWYAQQLGDVSGFEAHVTSNISKLDANAKDGVTTVFIGDSFFHQSAFFKNFDTIYRNKEAVCIGISTTTTYQWETFTKDWLKNYNPKNIVVNLGTNNMSLSAPFCSNENVVMALQSLLSLLKEKFPNTNIYWFSISPRTDMNRDADKVIINDQMKIWCNANGVTYVQSPVTDPAADCVDGLHPTAATYEKYAQALSAAGCEIVSKDTAGYQFFVDSTTSGVEAKPVDGTITIGNSVSKTETMFAASADTLLDETWQLTGTVTKQEMKNLFLSFGIRDESGKEQWFCIYQKGLSRQRYWNWEDTKYSVDNHYVFANAATEHFFYKTPSLGGDKLHYKLVIRDDILKAYFGNDQFDMTLAWQLPLTEELWGGFAAGSKYQLGINTVDPCAHTHSGVQILTGDAVPEEEKPDYSHYKFFVASAADGVTADPENGTIQISNSVSKTETMFAASADSVYSDTWQLTGTVTKNEMKNLFLSFGVRTEDGKEQWFCIYQKGLARQRYWNWANTSYQPDGKYVIANPASEHFFYKTPSLGGDKLHFKIVIVKDVLKAYFGNDMYDMTLAWQLPLTEVLWGGFAAGSGYQLGINTVDPCSQTYSDVAVVTGEGVTDEDSGQEEEKPDLFYLDSATAGVTADPQSGTITISNSVSKSETMLKANSQNKYATNWKLTGTITKKEHASQFFSFGIRDANGKEQWFCIYQKGLARQRYWNWANTKQGVDDVYVFANPASEHFFYQTYGLGGDTLHYKIVIENDVFKAYFGSDRYEMSLAWQLPLTEELWGGFAAGTAYQLGLNSVDACAMVISNVKVTTSTVVTKAISPILAVLPPKPEEETVSNSDNA